jgi:endonuclease/exonuclease/phosphatase family metal-dependent hydrolase
MQVCYKHFSKSILLLFLTCSFLHGQVSTAKEQQTASIMFYNVENLFDVTNDPEKADDDFTPEGARRWTYSRMRQKMNNISRVLLNAGGWDLPVIVGLCEVENSWVLNTMLRETGLDKLHYRSIHFDSPDLRGIDVAMLYRRNRFELAEARPVPVDFGKDERPTRDILYVKGVLDELDTLHILVNHWPSRLGGAALSHWKRKHAAMVVKSFTDSLMNLNPGALVILMGDFNEPPRSDLFRHDLNAGKLDDNTLLISPALYLQVGQGTLKYQHAWEIFDQIIVSRSFFSNTSPIKMNEPVLKIVDLPFLLERDAAMGGTRPFRTYNGFKYAGGFSDHLPVLIELEVKGNLPVE